MVAANYTSQVELLGAVLTQACSSERGFPPTSQKRHTMSCVLYVLVVFSMRKQKLGRVSLRVTTNNPNSPISSRLRFIRCACRTFRHKMRIRVASFDRSLPQMPGALAITYM